MPRPAPPESASPTRGWLDLSSLTFIGSNRVQHDNFCSRLVTQAIDKIVDLDGNLFVLYFFFEAVAGFVKRRHNFAAVAGRAVQLLIAIGYFFGCRDSKCAKSEIEIALDRHAVAQDRIELLARQPDVVYSLLQTLARAK